MSSEHKDEEAIFKAALKLRSPLERTNYLKKACEGDAKLLARVEAMLRAHDETGSFLESPPVDLDTTLDDPPVTEEPVTVTYRIEKSIRQRRGKVDWDL